ncbi:MAG: AAA+ family ATPase [Rhodobacteraceae bacterium]|nr:AAA+ family ATPase [Paracoccaceae bacterium]MCZ8084444.1 AAA+ family ATPase [Paracoccaceae bacterium]
MKHAVLILALALAPLPALAQETPAPEAEEGPSLMERGLALFFEGFRQELEPALEGMGDALTELQPALDSMMGMIDDITNYSMPEMLENGDIIMRRKPDAPPVEPPAAPGTDL